MASRFSPFAVRDVMDRPKGVHFIGIGGIGISSLARWFLARKWAVSGSDLMPNGTTKELRKLGVKVKIGHKKGNLPKSARLVIYSQAIEPENPELQEAKRLNIPYLSYPQALGELTRHYDTIAVAGMHGKSTTTALVGLILAKAGFDPTVIVGTKLKEFNGNFRSGKSKYLIIEADEYGGAFLNYSPTLSIVTNIDREHLDYYKNLANIKKSFLEFFKKTRRGGILVLNKDNAILFSLKPAIEKIAKKNRLKVQWYGIRDDSRMVSRLLAIMKIPGTHNISNALAALHAGMRAGVSQKIALRAIEAYHGSWRRMEYKGRCQVSGVRCQVYDDYAHHPTEIKATLQAFREKFGKQKIICVFQPHQAERLKALFKEFQTAFNDADATLILPIYKVPGRDASASSGQVNKFDSQKLVRAIQKKYSRKPIFYLADPKNLKKALKMLLASRSYFLDSAVVVMMGAGDIVRYTDTLLKK